MVAARELTEPVSLTAPDGRLNPDAVGWARRPVVDTSGIGPGPLWGRTKRWEYWNVTTPTHILALTLASLDYAAIREVWVFDRATSRSRRHAGLLPASGVQLAPRLDHGPARVRTRRCEIDIEPSGGSQTRLRARIPGVSVDITVSRGQDCLAVVVPWSPTRFQYTVKEVALPATGTLTIDGITHELAGGQSWAVCDHGRGRWPYRVRWNWGAGSGVSHGHTIGLQLGGRWTDGTGQTENGILVDGRLHKIHQTLSWEYTPGDWLRPWRVRGGGLDATLTPFYDKSANVNLGVLSSRADQCFGHWSGTFGSAGQSIVFDDILGWAEDVAHRW